MGLDMHRIRLMLPILFFASMVYAAETGKPFITVYPAIQTGGHFQNWALTQDNRGVMYIGNGYGVQEFDGSTWRMILNSNGSFAKSFAKDSSGRIFVGSAAELGYLAPDSTGAMRYVSLLQYLPKEDQEFNYVWFTHATPEGIYFQARERLFLFQKSLAASGLESWQVKVWRPASPDHLFMSSFFLDGALIVLQRGKGLMRMQGDSLHLLPGTASLALERINVMWTWPQSGSYLLGTNKKGLYVYNGSALTPFPTEADALLRSGNLSDGARLPDGSFAFCTQSNGFLMVSAEGNLILHLTNASGLLSNTVLAVFVDRQRNIWLAMDGGLAVLETGSLLAQFQIASGSGVNDIKRHLGILYISTQDGLYYWDDKNSQFAQVSGVPRYQSTNFSTIDNRLYASNIDGIYLIDNKRASHALQSEAAAPLLTCVHLSISEPNSVLAGSMSGMVFLRYDAAHPDKLKWAGVIPGFHEYIRQIVEPESGVFWLSTYDAGALRVRFRDNDFYQPIIERFGPEQGLPAGTTSVFLLGGRLIFGTGKGMYRFDEKAYKFQPDPVFKDLQLGLNPSECAAAMDAAGNIWACSGKGTALFRKEADGTYSLEKGQFSRFDDELVNVIYPEADGTTWFGVTGSVIRFKPGEDKTSHASLTALIRSVKLANDSTLYFGGFDPARRNTENYILPYRLNAVTFLFCVPSFIKAAANEYQFKLDGFENNWSTWSRDSKRNYTNLADGPYTFRVKARNIFGQESEEAVFSFLIETPWYSTWWALCGYALLALGFVFGLVRLRTRQLHQRSKVLEKIVQARTEEIRNQKDNVELLSRIGKDITATLSLENIIRTVHENVNALMEAAVFGIGLYNAEKKCLEFPATIEKKKTLPAFSLSLDDVDRLAVWCYANQKEVIINDYSRDYSAYIRHMQPPVAGENPESILYLPLVFKDKVIGVITAQSFNKNAYTEYHLHILRNLAAYTAIALDNAEAYRRVHELLTDLKTTQEKLVTQSKLAALGALTAGIAHEIKNPLNFVNNFAELINELIQELRQEMDHDPPNRPAIAEILHTLEQNAGKIIEHGKRADGIVRSMLQHSRGKSGERQPTDLNAMLQEDLNLAYHGMRAQDTRFNVKIETHLDPSLGKVEVVPQDISRVFLNIISNGFYEVHRKKMEQNGEYAPTVTVSTQNGPDRIEIRIRDNGGGIPAAVREKLFTPFFTTKPTGLGTGLGLSISYDIIVHQHNGQITFHSEEGRFTEFLIRLPK